jgi:hypothetical protein
MRPGIVDTVGTHGPRPGVTINGGKAHVRQPGLKPRTRCGIRIGPYDVAEHVEDVDQLDPHARCAKCFPGTGRPG